MSQHGVVPSTVDGHAAEVRELPRTAERRIDIRVPLDVPVLFDSMSAHGVTRSENVSLRGIELKGHANLRVGLRLLVYLELPIGLVVEERALVVRDSRAGVALRFLGLTRHGRAALDAFIRRELLRTATNDTPAFRRAG